MREKERVVRLTDVNVSFGGIHALRAVTTDIMRSQIVGVVGANGSGKTTLLNVMSGLVVPSSGSAIILGELIRQRSAPGIARRGVGRTFQLLDNFASVTVYEYVSMGLDQASRGSTRLDARRGQRRARAVGEALDPFQVERAMLHRPLSELSYGYRKRVDMARVFAASPDLILLDEPTSGLPDSSAADLLDCFREAIDEKPSTTVVVVDHHVSFLKPFCTQLIVLEGGNVLVQGDIHEVLASQAVRRSFLGEELSIASQEEAGDST